MTGRRMRLHVDRAACIGSGTCVQLAPDAFALDDERKARAVVDEVEGDWKLWAAVESCPVMAIVARDADTGARLYP